MSSDKNTPVFWANEDGTRTQIGWASEEQGGVRSLDLFTKYEGVNLSGISFGEVNEIDVEALSEPQPELKEWAPEVGGFEGSQIVEPSTEIEHDWDNEDAPLPAEPVELAPDPEQDADPIEVSPETPTVDGYTAEELAELEALEAEEESDEDTEPETRKSNKEKN